MPRKQLKIECEFCKKEHLKDESEINRNLKLNRKNFCSNSCSAKMKHREKMFPRTENHYDIFKHAGDKIDEYSDFRYIYKIVKSRKNKENDIDLEYLKQIWEYQKGICPYTGIQLKLIKHGFKFSDISKTKFEIASLDRIDSSKGYIKGNVCFVSRIINFMKNDLFLEETVNFLFVLKEYLKDKKDDDIVYAVKKFTEFSNSPQVH